jgi:hypothetical protein
MREIEYKIEGYQVEIYACDLKGGRTRWAQKVIRLFSGGREVGQAVFAREGADVPEPYLSGDKIFYFAEASLYGDVMGLLRGEDPVYIGWRSVQDPREPDDGDAYFRTDPPA